MNAIKGYFYPGSNHGTSSKAAKSRQSKPSVPPSIELDITPPLGSPVPTVSNGRGSLPSRSSSIFPEGDFRNGPRQNVIDIKSDVMVTWLNQQQLEKLWSSNLPNEGVVLKKGRDSFTCSPATLRNEGHGFFHQVIALNVKVSSSCRSCRYPNLQYVSAP
jgi:hypothetical protein